MPHIDGVYWTLWVELLFYVLMCGLLSIGLTERRVLAFAFLWPLVASLARVTHVDFLTWVLWPQYAPLFCGGMALYLIYSNGHSLIRWLLVIYNLCIAAQQTVDNFVMTSLQRNTGLDLSPLVGTLVVVGMFAVVAAVTVTPLRRVGPAWLSYAGALTYPLYLFHEAWGWWIIDILHDNVGKWVTLAVAVVVSVAIAAAVERWIDRPLRPRFTSLLKRGFVRGGRDTSVAKVSEPAAVERPELSLGELDH
ncbi:acyltransferase family protein [Microbacterium elymi]|uniref:Acyltransferase family protein n=1 Tax=Microbacterium elymi TaxID=2909587 RepID=A0ABY5NKM3_9MICO|nr:acyltransferase family protein [Microbacterium elymi]UUT35719.1 acyltransferase family protein [Microbacterium elymi]